MADNTVISPSGDTIRDLARQVGAVKTQVMQIDLGGATGNAEVLLTAGQQAKAQSMPVVIASDQGAVSVTNPDQTVAGSIAAVSVAVVLPLKGASGAAFRISGTWVATLQFEGSTDGGATYDAINAVVVTTSTPGATTTVNGLYRMTPGGLTHVRVVSTAFTSGTVNVTGSANVGTGGVFLNQIGPFKQTDGTNTVAIKGASTAAVAGDASAVVTFSPNSPLPAGANALGSVTVAALDVALSTRLKPADTLTGVTALGSITGALPAGANTIGAVTNVNLDVALSTRLKPADTLAGVTTVAAVTAITNALPAGANLIGGVNKAQINGVAPLMGNGVTGTGSQRVTIASDNTAFPVNSTLSAETTKVIGTVNLSAAQTLATVTTVSSVSASTPTTPTPFTLSSAATTNATSVKASAGTVYSVTASNVGAAAAFLKLFNLAVAPTVGTSVPLLTIPIAASGVANINFGPQGMRFSTGIAFSITNLVADADATAVIAAQVKVAIPYL